MEKQEMEMKRKLETEMGTKDHQSLVQYFLHSVLSHYTRVFYFAIVMGLAL